MSAQPRNSSWGPHPTWEKRFSDFPLSRKSFHHRIPPFPCHLHKRPSYFHQHIATGNMIDCTLFTYYDILEEYLKDTMFTAKSFRKFYKCTESASPTFYIVPVQFWEYQYKFIWKHTDLLSSQFWFSISPCASVPLQKMPLQAIFAHRSVWVVLRADTELKVTLVVGSDVRTH